MTTELKIVATLVAKPGMEAQLRKLLAKYPRSALLPDARQYLGSLNLKALYRNLPKV